MITIWTPIRPLDRNVDRHGFLTPISDEDDDIDDFDEDSEDDYDDE